MRSKRKHKIHDNQHDWRILNNSIRCLLFINILTRLFITTLAIAGSHFHSLTTTLKGIILTLVKDEYPSFLTQKSEPFDPIELAKKTEKIVCKGRARKYTDFYCTGVYGGISTGYTVGCPLKCVFCWVDWSRDFPSTSGSFISPEQVFSCLESNAKKMGVKKMRISGGEPILCPEHLFSILDLVRRTDYLFILETNGLLLGNDLEYVNRLKKYKNLHIRVSLKAGSPEGFENRTGGMRKFYDLPFQAIEYLRRAGVSFHVAAMTDSRLMPRKERTMMLGKLKAIGYQDYLEEERCDPYSTTLIRLKKAGFKLYSSKTP